MRSSDSQEPRRFGPGSYSDYPGHEIELGKGKSMHWNECGRKLSQDSAVERRRESSEGVAALMVLAAADVQFINVGLAGVLPMVMVFDQASVLQMPTLRMVAHRSPTRERSMICSEYAAEYRIR